jgi:hypothetical protein
MYIHVFIGVIGVDGGFDDSQSLCDSLSKVGLESLEIPLIPLSGRDAISSYQE